MGQVVDHTTLNRAAKYFMDSGKATTHDEAMGFLQSFGLSVHIGPEIAASVAHQTALLTLVNVARRTFLAGIEVVNLPDTPSVTMLAPGRRLSEAVGELGGKVVPEVSAGFPAAFIGNAPDPASSTPHWRLTWDGWRGGVVPVRYGAPLAEDDRCPLAPALAAAACAGEAFAYHSGDHPLAGRRASGLSLWRPGADWRAPDETEPRVIRVPSKLWIIGAGNLGQAFAWLFACLPYRDRREAEFLLQDFDRIAPSNESTSILSWKADEGRRKTRIVAAWLEARGFTTTLEERLFGPWIAKAPEEPNVALCGVDNALARAALEKPGFDLVIEAGLGAGPQAFRSFSIHTFPASRSAEEIWSRQTGDVEENFEDKPAYKALRDQGMDTCGLAQLASRTVGVPFVGLTAASLAVAEILRRLHGGQALELASGSAAVLEDIETVAGVAVPYAGLYQPVIALDQD